MDSRDEPVRQPTEHGAMRSEVIRRLNDTLRTARLGGQLFVTHGICCLGEGVVPAIIEAVSRFDAFTPDNDPHQEHDFGRLCVMGHDVCWKIDYYDCDMQHASPDPADPSRPTRVLTIMLAREY